MYIALRVILSMFENTIILNMIIADYRSTPRAKIRSIMCVTLDDVTRVNVVPSHIPSRTTRLSITQSKAIRCIGIFIAGTCVVSSVIASIYSELVGS